MFEDVKVFTPDVFKDFRGEIWTTYEKAKSPTDLDFNHVKYSTSCKNTIRGIHGDKKTWKLVSCLYGSMYFVVVDLRDGSGTYGEWKWMMLDDKNRQQVLLPPGFGNGFCVMSEHAIFSYVLSYPGEYSDVKEQFTVKWNDPGLNIIWPINNPILQERDR